MSAVPKPTLKLPEAPTKLRKRGRTWYLQVVAQFELDDHELALVEAAAEMLDRADAARRAIRKEGLIATDRFDQAKPHPAVAIEREAMLAFVRIRRELALDDAAAADTRPPLPKGYR